MKKVFIIHGFEGSPNGGWRPWLMAELEKQGIYACALPMPSPKDPKVPEWIEEIRRQVEASKRDAIYLVGHSLGVPAILRFLEGAKAKNVKGAVLVSGPIYKTNKKKVAAFLKQPFDFDKIRSKTESFVVIHGDNDPYVPVEQGKFLAERLKARLVILKNGGHLNGSSGHTSLPQVLLALQEMLS